MAVLATIVPQPFHDAPPGDTHRTCGQRLAGQRTVTQFFFVDVCFTFSLGGEVEGERADALHTHAHRPLY